nr:anti-sigma factor [Lentzea guizhouensis]
MHSLEPDEEHWRATTCRPARRAKAPCRPPRRSSRASAAPSARNNPHPTCARGGAETPPRSHRHRTPPPHAARHAAPQHRRRTGRLLLAAAAAVAVLAAGGYLGVRVNQLSGEVAASQARTDDLTRALTLAADPATNRALLRSTGSGQDTAVVLSGPTAAAVMPMNLKPNDSGHIYVVWGASTDTPVPLALFDVSAGSTDPELLTWSADAHKHTTFAVSLEPGRQAPPRPSDVLASGQVAPA